MGIETVIEDERWAELDLPDLAARAFDTTLHDLELDPSAWEATLLACDDARIAALNEQHRGKPNATNVLSWPSAERGAETEGESPSLPTGDSGLGDIAIAYETCMSEAHEAGKPAQDHVTHLIIHGVLHLLGYDHERSGDAALMESLETAILCKLGVPDPY